MSFIVSSLSVTSLKLAVFNTMLHHIGFHSNYLWGLVVLGCFFNSGIIIKICYSIYNYVIVIKYFYYLESQKQSSFGVLS